MQIWLREDLREVLFGEIPDDRARMPPQRDGQDPLALQQVLRYFGLHIAEERVLSGETMVLRGN
jgi:hypothetical protein